MTTKKPTTPYQGWTITNRQLGSFTRTFAKTKAELFIHDEPRRTNKERRPWNTNVCKECRRTEVILAFPNGPCTGCWR